MSDHHIRTQPWSLTRRTFLSGSAITLASVAAGSAFAATAPVNITETDVSIRTADGTADAVLVSPSAKGRWPAVILWHDLAGLRPVYRAMARRLAGEGFVVLVPNAFYRSGRATGEEIDLRDAGVREAATARRAAATDDGIARDAVAYVAYLDALGQVARRKKIGTVGYDLGGSYAFRTAAAVPDRVAAVASIHGLGAATARPNSPHLLVPKTKARYFIVQSKDDDAREPGDKDDYTKVIAEAKLKGVVEVYPANHGFGVPGNANYDAASAERAWGEIVTLLKTNL
jgi:carboxymethylenebutenolidase